MPKTLNVWTITNYGKLLKRWETRPPYLPLRNLYAGQEASKNWTWNNRLVPNQESSMSRLYIVTLLFNLYAEYIMRNAGLNEAQAGIKIAGRNQ